VTPEQVIKKIAEIASDVAWQAGVGGMETAGQFVSVLAAHPEKIEGFLAGTLSIIDDGALLRADQGCLTWHARDGRVVSPEEARAAAGQKQH
jgi:hypothetical protein